MHKYSGTKAIALMVGLGLGNFFFQAFLNGAPAWPVAVERTFFQAIAVGAAWMMWG